MSVGGSVAPDAPLRLFLALDLPHDARAALAAWAHAAVGWGRRVREDDLHVTLAFLGARPAGEVPAIVETLRQAAERVEVGPLEVRRWRVTRSVGMLVLADPEGGATRLRELVRARLAEAGIPVAGPEPWLPHVTVVRHRVPDDRHVALPAGRTLVPSDATAYLSRLSPTGARYTALARLPLHRTTEEGSRG